MLEILDLSSSMLIFPLACHAEGQYICRPEESTATSETKSNVQMSWWGLRFRLPQGRD